MSEEAKCQYFLMRSELSHNQRLVIHLLVGLSLENEEVNEETDLKKAVRKGCETLGDLRYLV